MLEINKEYFYKRIDVDIKTECWNWKGAKDKNGYGCLKNKRKYYFSHRKSYEAFKGNIPNGLLVCHKCDNPACCNPKHLFIGTQQDNMSDMINKGRDRKNTEHNYGNNYAGKQILAGGKLFKSLSEAGRFFGITSNGIKKRINLGWKGYSVNN